MQMSHRIVVLASSRRHARVAVLLLCCVLISSCAPKHRIEVEFRDGHAAEYSLVSMRDSTIVVQPTYELTDTRYLAYTHMSVLQRDSVYRVRIPVSTDLLSSLPAMLIGATIGATVGKPCDCEDKLSKAVIGLAIGWNLDKLRVIYAALTNHWLFLWAPDDRKRIHEEAIFPEEPPIMKYVK